MSDCKHNKDKRLCGKCLAQEIANADRLYDELREEGYRHIAERSWIEYEDNKTQNSYIGR